jgi:single-stranded DNA-binding protein
MSEINSNNYTGANVVIVGNVVRPVEIKDFKNGGSQAELSIAVSKGYKKDGEWVDTGTDYYTLVASADYASDNWPRVDKGDKVRIDESRLEFKPYLKNDGTPGVEAQLRFGTLVVVEAKADKPSSGSEEVTPF